MKKIFSSIDIGSDSIKIVVCEYFQNKLNVLASIKKSSSGIENGIIIDKERAKMSINEALKDINSSLGVKIDKAIINVPMYDSEYMVNEGSTTITNENKVVTGNDMVNALQGSIYNKIPKSRELVTIQPIKYNVDDEKKDLLNPRGIRADKLYVTSMCMTVPKKNIYVVISILQELNIEVIDILFGIIGDYYEFKSKEISNGVCGVINIGSDKIETAVFKNGIMFNSNTLKLKALINTTSPFILSISILSSTLNGLDIFIYKPAVKLSITSLIARVVAPATKDIIVTIFFKCPSQIENNNITIIIFANILVLSLNVNIFLPLCSSSLYILFIILFITFTPMNTINETTINTKYSLFIPVTSFKCFDRLSIIFIIFPPRKDYFIIY